MRGGPLFLAALITAGGASPAGAGGVSLPPADWARFSLLTPAGPLEPVPEVFGKLKRLVYAEHRVVKGEYSAWHLAKLYNTTAMSLQTTNNDELILLYPGKKVVVHNKDGLLYEVKKDSESLSQIVAKYRKNKEEARKFRESVILANELPGSAFLGEVELGKGSRVLLPKVQISFDTYRFPFESAGWARISSRFGSRMHPVTKIKRFHEGLDLAKSWGTPVYPSRSGVVIEAGWHGGYGQLIVLRHSDGFTTRYGHLSKINVKVGQTVQRGRTMIGRVGSTGLSTGPHLHFEVRDRAGRAVNPGSKIGRR
jgi:murein DD-endopeptidase MepM/ murein hydrolase activator NlpD